MVDYRRHSRCLLIELRPRVCGIRRAGRDVRHIDNLIRENHGLISHAVHPLKLFYADPIDHAEAEK